MLPLAEAKQVHARWSPVNGDFLEFVERNPEYLSRASFASLSAAPGYRKFTLQPWPLFIGPEQLREMEEVALGIDRLVKSTLARFLRGEPARVIEYFRSELLEEMDPAHFLSLELSEEVLDLVLAEPSGIQGALSRADYIETADGSVHRVQRRQLPGRALRTRRGRAVPGLARDGRFLAERGLRTREPRTLGALFRHLLDDTARIGAWKEGEFNVAVLARPHDEQQVALHDPELYQRQLDAALAADGRAPGGRVLLCAHDELVDDEGVLTVFGHPCTPWWSSTTGSGTRACCSGSSNRGG
jgi:hypothetical protein